jgi:hypothetical protein
VQAAFEWAPLSGHRARVIGSPEGRSWLSEASELCRTYGFQNWIAQIDGLATSQPPTMLRR